MASKNTCRACLQALRARSSTPVQTLQRGSQRSNFAIHQSRALSTSLRNQQQATAPPATPREVNADLEKTALEVSPDAEKSLPPGRTPSASELQAAIQGNKALSRGASLAHSLRKHAKGTTETYIAFGATERMFKNCASVAAYTMPKSEGKDFVGGKVEAAEVTEDGQELGIGNGSWWYKDLSLSPTFSIWAQITMLHMYILTVRIRVLDAKTAPIWHQHLTDHFFNTAEELMIKNHNISARMLRTRYLKDLHQQWRGVLAAYDEGLIKGDAVMAGALWRNIFGGKEDVDVVALAGVVNYLRRELKRVGAVSEHSLEAAEVEFGASNTAPGLEMEKRSVLAESPMMKKGFETTSTTAHA